MSDYDFNDLKQECYVYIIKCKDNTLYTGISCNLLESITDHKAGLGSRYTKRQGFDSLVYFERCSNRSTALRREREIKSKGVRYKHLLINNFRRYVFLLK